MSWTEQGGAAFPGQQRMEPNGEWNQTFEPGMSIRDWFAAHAPMMPDQWWEDSRRETPQQHWAEAQAAWAYFYADAMLAERARQSEFTSKTEG